MYIDGICCELCIKKESNDCPVKNASPWSRWKNFCNEFTDRNGKNGNGKNIEQILKDKYE
jgi:hypothetical protein